MKKNCDDFGCDMFGHTDECRDASDEFTTYLLGRLKGRKEGAAVAFGLVGMAEAIRLREHDPNEDYCAGYSDGVADAEKCQNELEDFIAARLADQDFDAIAHRI